MTLYRELWEAQKYFPLEAAWQNPDVHSWHFHTTIPRNGFMFVNKHDPLWFRRSLRGLDKWDYQ